ncbi:MAG: VCBS repeat-containing protein [Pseudomonadota bacterium]
MVPHVALFVCLLCATFAAAADIERAVLDGKTGRYGHDVLGGNEYAGLAAFSGDRVFRVDLPEDRVFEDIEARLADVNGDGAADIVVVESSKQGGAELAVYSVTGDSLTKVAATPPIGRRNRWLAPAGIVDLNADGRLDIAYVEKPHIGGALRIWTLRDGDLVEIARDPGYSNHRIGEDFITGGVRACGNGPELILPDFRWRELLAVRLEGTTVLRRTIGQDTGSRAVADALACKTE